MCDFKCPYCKSVIEIEYGDDAYAVGGEYPYKCEECGEKFILKAHIEYEICCADDDHDFGDQELSGSTFIIKCKRCKYFERDM